MSTKACRPITNRRPLADRWPWPPVTIPRRSVICDLTFMNDDGPTYAERYRKKMRSLTRLGLATLLLIGACAWPAAATPIVTSGDASISHNGTTWSIAAGGATLTPALDSAPDFTIPGPVTPPNPPWTTRPRPGTTIT